MDIPQSTDIEFSCISAIIRMAHKYQFEVILKKFLGVLQSYYTNDHQLWIAREANPLKAQPRDAFEAVLLARLTDTPSILPAALLQCSALGPDLLEGYMRNGVTPVALSQADTLLCLRARESLLKADTIDLRRLSRVVSMTKDCEDPDKCLAYTFKIWQAVTSGFPGYDRSSILPLADVISLLGEHKQPQYRNVYCFPCWKGIVGLYYVDHRRAKLWDDLPRLFELKNGLAGGDDSNTVA